MTYEEHKEAVLHAAIGLCAAFNAAQKDHYAFNVHLSPLGGTDALPAFSDFYR